MNLLLDTHILIWSWGELDRVGRKSKRLLNDEATPVWLSPINAWESLILAEKIGGSSEERAIPFWPRTE